MRTILIFSALALVCVLQAQAQDRVGNGGDVLVCEHAGGKRSYQMLDLYQAVNDYGLTIDMGPSTHDHRAMVEFVLNRLALLQPYRARMYFDIYKNFWNEADFKKGITLVDVPDTGAQAIPSNCHLEQIAVQRSPGEMMPGLKRYIVNLDLWNAIDEVSKATLIVHEIIYNQMLKTSCVASSAFVRYLTAHLGSSEINAVDFQSLMINARQWFFEVGTETIWIDWHPRYSQTCSFATPWVIGGFWGALHRPPGPRLIRAHDLGYGRPRLRSHLFCGRILNDPNKAIFEGCGGATSLDVDLIVGKKRFIASIKPSSDFDLALFNNETPGAEWELLKGYLAADFFIDGKVCRTGSELRFVKYQSFEELSCDSKPLPPAP